MKKRLIALWYMACFLSTSLSAQVASVIDYTYDAKGQVSSIAEGGTTLTYYYDAGGNRITPSQVNGINNPDVVKQSLRCYPNPAKNEVWIEFETSKPGNAGLALYTVTGQQAIAKTIKIVQPGMQKFQMDVSSLTCGLYAIRMVTESYSGTVKMLKIE